MSSSVKTPPSSRNSWSLIQGSQRLVQGRRGLRNVLQLLRGQLVEILVDRLMGLDAVLDAVQAGHQHGREGQVGVAGGVGSAELACASPSDSIR